MPDETSREKNNDVVGRKGDYEVSKRDGGISITDTTNRSRSLDIDVNRSGASAGVTWKIK